MHIKRDISIWNLKTILNVLFRMRGVVVDLNECWQFTC